MEDYCFLCGEPVKKDEWRKHMKNTHHVVLSESPKWGSGKWKKINECKSAKD